MGTSLSVSLTVGILVVTILCTIFLWKKTGKNVRLMERLPGPPKRLLFGNVLEFESETSAFDEQLVQWSLAYNTYGIFCIWVGPTFPYIFAYKPAIAEMVLSSSKHMSKSLDYALLHPWLGTDHRGFSSLQWYKSPLKFHFVLFFSCVTFVMAGAAVGEILERSKRKQRILLRIVLASTGLLTSTGEKWKKRRKMITPTFHFNILNDFLQVFEEQSEVLLSILKSRSPDEEFNIFPVIANCTLDVICKTSMGVSVDAHKGRNSEYVKAVLRISQLQQERYKTPWLWENWIYNLTPSGRENSKCVDVLHGFTIKVINERIQERCSSSSTEEREVDESTGKRKRRLVAFLDLLLDAYDEGQIDKEGIREEVDTFMFEGHDTTAAGISWTIQLLGSHPDVQKKVQQEVDGFFESRPEHLIVDSLKCLKYLECTIKESLRICPPVPYFSRTLSEDCKIDRFLVPKGTSISVSPFLLHHNPDVWPDPMRFDPDRFLPENIAKRHPYAFIPFSAGPRNCIGQRFALLELKIVLASILRHFTVKSMQTLEGIKSCAELILRPRDGIFITLTPRS